MLWLLIIHVIFYIPSVCFGSKTSKLSSKMGDTRLSVAHATYFPPSLQPGYMGAYPPQRSDESSMYKSGNINYFQNYRNEIAKLHMPKDDWGIMSTPYSPKADLVAANKTARIDSLFEVKNFDLTFDDPARRKQIDDFFKVCQQQRDTYRDHTGQHHAIDYFRKANYLYSCPPDITSSYLKSPTRFVEYKKPQTLPLTYNRTYISPTLPERCLAGTFDKADCVIRLR